MGVRANLVAGVKDCWETKQPGDFTYTGSQNMEGKHGMVFVCPCGCGDVGGIDFDTVPETPKDDQRWSWNGNIESPTLHPSLNKTAGCGWHGFLRNGIFEEA